MNTQQNPTQPAPSHSNQPTSPTSKSLTRRGFLKTLAQTAAVTAFAGCSLKNPPSSKPNIVIFLADDIGYSDLGCYGGADIQTPRLDKLASQGVRFTAFYAASPNCSPSRAALLTGRIPARIGIYHYINLSPEVRDPQHLPASEITIAEILKNSGYDTCHVGKWHLNRSLTDPTLPQPRDHGFDYSFGTENIAIPDHKNPVNFHRNGEPVGPLKGYACQLVVDDAISWLEKRPDRGKPFFAYVSFNEGHNPYGAPQEIIDRYLAPENAANPDAVNRATYCACVENMDNAIGRFLDYLDENHLTENTWILFYSDNGARFPESCAPLRGWKTHLWEGGIRVPGILRWDGSTKPGMVIDEPVAAVDMLPTICEAAGSPLPTGRPIDGVSILPLFKGGTLQRNTPLFWYFFWQHGDFPAAALREGPWVLVGFHEAPDIEYSHPLTAEWMSWIKTAELVRFELYNTETDLAQEHDLADREPGRLESMKQRMLELHRSVIAEGPTWEFE
jgi:arylsulfatase